MMDSRKQKRIRALIVVAVIIIIAVVVVQVFARFILPWILALHGL